MRLRQPRRAAADAGTIAVCHAAVSCFAWGWHLVEGHPPCVGCSPARLMALGFGRRVIAGETGTGREEIAGGRTVKAANEPRRRGRGVRLAADRYSEPRLFPQG